MSIVELVGADGEHVTFLRVEDGFEPDAIEWRARTFRFWGARGGLATYAELEVWFAPESSTVDETPVSQMALDSPVPDGDLPDTARPPAPSEDS